MPVFRRRFHRVFAARMSTRTSLTLIVASTIALATCLIVANQQLHARDPFTQAFDGSLIGKRLSDVERLCGPAWPVPVDNWMVGWRTPTSSFILDYEDAAVVRFDRDGLITECAYVTINTDSPNNPWMVKTHARWPRDPKATRGE
ncbi:MAG: hypothetical protein K2X32_11420 [Phycisphaerales bacterium]|nr:hypothetical protein [Phycisphaerales bacterium]